MADNTARKQETYIWDGTDKRGNRTKGEDRR